MNITYIDGDDNVFNALTGQMNTQNSIDYFRNSVANMATVLGERGSQFIQQTKDVFNKFNSSEALNNVRSAIASMSTHIDDNVILTLNETSMFKPNGLMQQYMMVEPTIFSLHQDNACSGFDGVFQPVDPITTVEDNALYCRVMDGMLTYKEDDEYATFFTYADTFTNPLLFDEQIAVQDTWRVMKDMIASNIDPTSPDGEEL